MNRLNLTTTFPCAFLASALTIGLTVPPSHAADHIDAPFIQGKPRLDIADLYVFGATSPDQFLDAQPPLPPTPPKTAFIMTVSPNAGNVNPSTFHPNGWYEFLIDTDDDAEEDFIYRITFSDVLAGNVQDLEIRREDVAAMQTELLAQGQTGQDFNGQGPSGHSVRAMVDVFDDPFSFDFFGVQGSITELLSTPNPSINPTPNPPPPPPPPPNPERLCDMNQRMDKTDVLNDQNVLAIVLEVPDSDLGASQVKIWARTRLTGLQTDRMGSPAVSTFFIPGALNLLNPPPPILKDAYNATQPQGDQTIWKDEVKFVLNQTYPPMANLNQLADMVLPDTLPWNPADPQSFPNGRRLEDEVVDEGLAFVTNGQITDDCLTNGPFLTAPGTQISGTGSPVQIPVFPYLNDAN